MLEKQRILVVDDTPSNIKILNDLLKERYHVSFAINGQDALTLAASDNPPDLILLDIMMPGMDGYSVCRQLKQHRGTQGIPVIFVTAMTGNEDEVRGFAAGCVDYITKPVRPAVALARIKTHLELRKAKARTQRLLSKTLLGSVRMMADIMSVLDPDHFSQSSRLKRLASQIGSKMGLTHLWQLEIAATLSQIEKIAVPPRILDQISRCRLMTGKDHERMRPYAAAGKELLSHIPSMGEVAEIISRQHDPLPDLKPNQWDMITTCGQIIKLVWAYDHLLHCGQRPDAAIRTLEKKPEIYARNIAALLKEIEYPRTRGIFETIDISKLKPRMVLLEDLICDDGVVLIKRYTELSEETLLLLKKNASLRKVAASVRVIIPE